MIAITPGDPAGIGPEIVWKTLQSRAFARFRNRVIVVGAEAPFREFRGKRAFDLLPAPESTPQEGLHLGGFQSGWAIERAARMAIEGRVEALVTGPISKEHLQAGGFPFPGHTEMLARLAGDAPVTMMLANSRLRVSLATTHVALGSVPAALTREKLRRAVLHTYGFLRKQPGMRKPRIAVCGLNPHAGEKGLFGREEGELIAPECEALRREWGTHVQLDGPLPADTLFARHFDAGKRGLWDAVVCMYHDQGLIPVKLIDFARTVNITLGLPFLRTSVDHGTAFDIAGRGIADPSSFQSALKMAINGV